MTRPIPQGFQTVTPSVIFKDAAAAIALYEKALDAKVEYKLLMPGSDKIMHACLTIGTSKLFLCDESHEMQCYAAANNQPSVSFYLYVPDPDAAYKKALSAGMKEMMPVQDMFWGDRMGVVTDPFGYKWNLAAQVKTLSQDEIEKAAKKAFSKAA